MKKLFTTVISAIALLASYPSDAQVLRLPADFDGHDPEMIANVNKSLFINPTSSDRLILKPIAEDETNKLAAELLEYASKYKGVRYRSGGKTPAGFDCSGFTGYVFREFGYDLSTSSRAQYSDGRAVNRDEIQPGDLVFFKGRSSKSAIGHVGIAISADPVTGVVTFIHAATSGGIKVDTTAQPYYSSRFVGARRVLPD